MQDTHAIGRAWTALDARSVRRAGLDDSSLTDGLTLSQPKTSLASRSTGELACSFPNLKMIFKPETPSRAWGKLPECFRLHARSSNLTSFASAFPRPGRVFQV